MYPGPLHVLTALRASPDFKSSFENHDPKLQPEVQCDNYAKTLIVVKFFGFFQNFEISIFHISAQNLGPW